MSSSSPVNGGQTTTISGSRRQTVTGIVLRKKKFVLCVVSGNGVRRVGEERWFKPSALLRMKELQLQVDRFRRVFDRYDGRYGVRRFPEFKAALPELGRLACTLRDKFMRYRRKVPWLPAPDVCNCSASSCHGRLGDKKKKKNATRHGRAVLPLTRTLVFFRDRRPGHLQFEFVTGKSKPRSQETEKQVQVLAQLEKLKWSRLM